METIHYFTNSNSSKGYASLFQSNFGGLGRLVTLSAFPSAAAESVIQAVMKEARQRSLDLEVTHNCLTNEAEGVILPQLGAGVVSLPVYDPEVPCGLYALENDSMEELREELKKARNLFAGALKVHDEWEKIYIAAMDFGEMNALALETAEMMLKDAPARDGGTAVHRFFGAATENGSFDYIQNITQEIPKRYFIKGRPGTGKSTFLKKVAEKAVACGFRTEIYHCAFDPDSLDMVAIRALGICLFDSTAPHEYFPERTSDEIIDVYTRAVKSGTDEANAATLAEIGGAYKQEVVKATACLKKAATAWRDYEKKYLPMSAEVLAEVRAQTIAKLF